MFGAKLSFNIIMNLLSQHTVLLLTLAFFNLHGVLGDNVIDMVSLLSFKTQIFDDPHGAMSSWNESTHFCLWQGISCGHRHQRVTVLDLEGLQLKGYLSSHIGNLSFLRILNLRNNSFSGNIPEEMGRLFRLQALRLGNNFFSGEIPVNISRCSNLMVLSLYNNNLIRELPKFIGSLSRLQVLLLNSNNLVGKIPIFLGNLSFLELLDLADNRFHGDIPCSLGQLKRLIYLSVCENSLTGIVPLSLYNLSSLEYFFVCKNKLHGSLPPNLGHSLPNLDSFLFHTNQFSGPIPNSISNSSKLSWFEISTNQFYGKIPSFASLPNLESFLISTNNLGHNANDDLNFLFSLVNCTHLKMLFFYDNNIGGVLPEILSNFSKELNYLQFGLNKIRGSIPTGIGNLANLWTLFMEENQLTGPIPSSIGKLKNLYQFGTYENKLYGFIPSFLGNLSSLGELYLSFNNLQGSIPSSLGDCKKLLTLDLSQNKLSGPIPKQVMNLSSLSRVLDLSGNRLTGSIPMEVGQLVNLVSLIISENKLSGDIPSTLGSCTSLVNLYLEGNLFHGTIPNSLSSLRGIEEIDLSSNGLSGKIPLYFEDFRFLQKLNLSWNKFDGEVPVKGIFKNDSALSIIGNPRLCGGISELKIPKCSSSLDEKHKLSPKCTILIVSGVVALVLLLLLVLIFWSRKRIANSSSESSFELSFFKVSYGELFKATDGFSSTNLIGVGSFGSVYKGILNQGTRVVAVKVFMNLQTSKAQKSFVAECKALKSIKHRNLVKVLSVCSSIDFQGNDFKALIYEFMANGCLEEWLHPSHLVNQEQGQRHLNFIQRMKISIDVANALDYLHNNSHVPIAHCDLKPSNILLDDDMTGRVGDFGLAMFLPNYSQEISSQLTSSIGMRGSIGYVAPEYGMGSEVSTAGDVYSYGILLLEMFTGRRPTDDMFKDDQNIRKFTLEALPECVEQIVDPMLFRREYNSTNNGNQPQSQRMHECLTSILRIGLACSAEQPQERMSISNVVTELCHIRDSLLRTGMA